MTNTTRVNPLSILFMVLLLAALIGGVVLVNQNQETRKGAYFSGATLLVLPEAITAKVNDSVPVQLWVETEGDSRVSSVDAKICYGSKLALNGSETEAIDLNQEAFKVLEYAKDQGGCLRLLAVSSGISPENLKSGLVKVASISFKATGTGSGNITIDVASAKVNGYNPEPGATDASMKIGGVTGASYVIEGTSIEPSSVPTSVSGAVPILKFKMTFYGMASNAGCADAVDMPLVVGVRAKDGVSKSYNGIIPVKTGDSVGGFGVYSVSLPLIGFNYTSDVAVFVKGPKHLQVKYGVDGQDSYYGVAGGQLSGLTDNTATTKVFDFTKYPLLAGDVTGVNGKQDGVVDGLDFSYVKSEANKRTSYNPGDFVLADLNGNCQMESQDLSALMLSLSVKQEQLY